ncbi:MAG: 23S rRNA (pseudouridine(1915)-N(3))-methyltransferase RlmH [Candidatus Cloacimonetes bacterium]|jgi:23S rRNA (pseudouridine1915-N3)-methyltransferase|nr:23S rRNA (pseudouridine(1915)-N(3))-methyltransferase RlmH [Candidatus Cloacimonadota bacterium]MDD2506527.1 23S rRNA (pseudouridine(1915)-N(3))-methyltransferase RlmH [Candidatus Cloacimonadota bacterium]MDD4147698.1 23S rRNA (pseudouridine(1915)-N(3))-methyltransferase RlmH [Candidatus Cloacimonadota bacterium]MDD4559398.1 23S rRNA (pseudouridine(1915)-N(3))-methyltransferase RlmH [Candidatus Cloacimonadota bacterium]
MKIRIIQLGKDKDSWLTVAISEYLKRIKPYCKLDIVQLPDVSIKETGNKDLVIKKEGQEVLSRIETGDYLVLLDEKGTMKTSLDFSQFLTNISIGKRIVFVIGGVYGSSDELKASADVCLSLSSLTFTHRIARLVLIEQIYRAMMIKNGRQYHIE